MPSSRGSSPPRDWTQVFHIVGRFFTVWATREAPGIDCTGKSKFFPASNSLLFLNRNSWYLLILQWNRSDGGGRGDFLGPGRKKEMKSLSCIRVFATPWTVAYQAPLSMGFSRQEYWSGLPFPSPEDLPDPEIEPGPPALQADALASEPPWKYLVLTSRTKILPRIQS